VGGGRFQRVVTAPYSIGDGVWGFITSIRQENNQMRHDWTSIGSTLTFLKVLSLRQPSYLSWQLDTATPFSYLALDHDHSSCNGATGKSTGPERLRFSMVACPFDRGIVFSGQGMGRARGTSHLPQYSATTVF
jgi:hypothetical protein